MDRKKQIREGLKALAGEVGPMATMLATVVSVDEEEMTCVLLDDDLERTDVRLRPVLNGNEGVTIFPVVGSWVLAVRIEEDEEWMVIAADQVSKYRLVVGEMLFEMKDGKYLVQSGNDSLGKCLDDLIIQIQAIYAPKNAAAITAIQNRLKLLLNGA